MAERDTEGRRAAARPLLAYAPEFLDALPVAGPFTAETQLGADIAEHEHRLRREELFRRKQAVLDDTETAYANDTTDPRQDILDRMSAVRDALQTSLGEQPTESTAPEPEPTRADQEKIKARSPRRRWGRVLGFVVVGGLIGAGYGLLFPAQYGATASLLVTPMERRSEIASQAVFDRAAQLARIQTRDDLGKPSFFEQLRQELETFLVDDDQPSSVPTAKPEGAAILRPHVSFVQALGSGAISVTATAATPETAAVIANAVTQAFRDYLADDANPTDRDLPERLQSLETDAQTAKQAAAAFRASRNFGDAGSRTALDREFAESKAATLRISAEANALNSATPESLLKNGVPDSLRSGALGQLVERYAAAGQGDAAKTIESQINTEIASQRRLLQADLKAAVEREQKAAAAVAGRNAPRATDEDRSRLQALERDAAARQVLLEDLQMRAVRGEATAAGAGAHLRVIASARPNPTPRGLSMEASVLLGLLGGLLLGLLSFAFGRKDPVSPQGRVEIEPEEVLETYGETRLAAVIREANARWEAEHGRANGPKENVELRRTIDDVRSSRFNKS
ncbi:lipopolysaccharide biosynthesis protein [Ochrobactrum sp. CM-21-5]|nr:lipopolysaccharide biosynthesis protein [Ochrobactrum sp. CM-21-5]MBC2885708.1 lipopolysaccharide biosynthesis protein [Ochrobactrum sp. CM-21-5]